MGYGIKGGCGCNNGSSLLFFFLLLAIIFCNCGGSGCGFGLEQKE